MTDKGQIIVLHLLPSGVVPVIAEEHESYTSKPSVVADVIVSCDNGTFCLVQCGVAHSPPPQPMINK